MHIYILNSIICKYMYVFLLRENEEYAILVLEKTLESPLDCKEIQPVHSEGDQPSDLFGRTDAQAETPILWPPHAKSWLIGKDSDAGRDWGQEENGMTEDEMAGWHHRLDGRESEWTPGDGDEQGGLACCNSWGRTESDSTEWLNWTRTGFWSQIGPTPSLLLTSMWPSTSFWSSLYRLLECKVRLINNYLIWWELHTSVIV